MIQHEHAEMPMYPSNLAADTFTAALEAIPAEDWYRTWAADRTIMLRMTSKRVKEIVDKMRLPVVVRLSRSFWGDARNGTAAEKLQFVMRQLTALTISSFGFEKQSQALWGKGVQGLGGRAEPRSAVG